MLFCFLLFHYNCLKKFTIDSNGGNIITTNIQNYEEFSSIAITNKGTFIKYKSDSSIISTEIKEDLAFIDSYIKAFMCQYSTNKVILIRDDEIKEIELDTNGNVNTVSNAITLQNIVSLQCNIQNSLFVITYLTGTDDQKNYNFKVYDSLSSEKYSFSSTDLSEIVSSSCILLDKNDDNNFHVLCLNVLLTNTKYI